MPQMHQVLAAQKGVLKDTKTRITAVHHSLARATGLTGFTRTYRPIVDGDTETLPEENVKVQVKGTRAIVEAQEQLERLLDIQATRDWGNLEALADVTLEDGTVLIPQAPATYLLWLEKELDDLRKFINSLPILDPAQDWTFSEAQDLYEAKPTTTIRTKKVPKVLVKAEATEKHPAQTEVYPEDVPVGEWTKREYSGAFPATLVRQMSERVEAVIIAVATARAKANETEVTNRKIAGPLLSYVFQGQTA